MSTLVTVTTTVNAPLQRAWDAWTTPRDVQAWNAASDDWECPSATNDLQVGGEFHYRMAARDRSFSFDYWGTYVTIVPLELIEGTLGDGRSLRVEFTETAGITTVTETFEIEDEHSAEMQRTGWQAILDRFKKYVESAS